MPNVLLDGRGSAAGGTGTAVYVRSLAGALSRTGVPSVLILCRQSERRTFEQLGAETCQVFFDRLRIRSRLPDVAVTHGPSFRVLPHRDAKKVVTIHDLAFIEFPDDYPSKVVHQMTDNLARQEQEVHRAICISRATERDLLSVFPGYSGRTEVIYHGVEEAWFDAIAPQTVGATLERLGVRPPYLLHIGALVPRKDIPTLMLAWDLAREAHPQLSLVLAGPAALRWKSDIGKVAAILDAKPTLRPDFHALGYVDDSTARALMAGARAYVCTSRCEGFGLPVLEAMAAGVPVVASRVAALDEIARETAWFGAVGDPEDIATAIRAALDSSDEARLRAAAERARDFSWTRCADQTSRCYSSLLGES